MDLYKEFDIVFNKFQKSKHRFSDADLDKEMYNYVYFSNKLEGNQLTLSQTTTLLKSNITSGDLPLRDYLEAKGHFKSIKFIVNAALNKYPLTEKLLKQANELTLSAYWAIEDAYPMAKSNNQRLGDYKIYQNKVQWVFEGEKGTFIPLSDEKNVENNMQELLQTFNTSAEHIIKKAAYIAYQIYINQPFCDGNKRTARLITTFVTLQAGLPFTSFDKQAKKNDFNRALLSTYMHNDSNYIENFLLKEFITTMLQIMEEENKGGSSKVYNFML